MTNAPSPQEQASLKLLDKHFRDRGKQHKVAAVPDFSDKALNMALILVLSLGTIVGGGLPSLSFLLHSAADNVAPSLRLNAQIDAPLTGNVLRYSVPMEKQLQNILAKKPSPEVQARLAAWHEAVGFAKNLPSPKAKALVINWAANAAFPYSSEKVRQENEADHKEQVAWNSLFNGDPSATWASALKLSVSNFLFDLRRAQFPQETLERGEGMCVDIAILKADALIEAGIKPDNVGVLFLEHAGGRGHAVTVYNQDGIQVLNNRQTKPENFNRSVEISQIQTLDSLTQNNEQGGWRPTRVILGNGQDFPLKSAKDIYALPQGSLAPLEEPPTKEGAMSDTQIALYYIQARTEPNSEAAKMHEPLLANFLPASLKAPQARSTGTPAANGPAAATTRGPAAATPRFTF